MGRHRRAVLVLIPLLFLAACSDSDSGETTTTGDGATTSTTGTDDTASSTSVTAADDLATVVTADPGGGPTTTSSDIAAATIPEYSIQARIVGEAGDTVVVFVEPATYTDLDIENVVADVVTRFAPITTVHVVDDRTVVDLVLSEESALTPEEVANRDAHYFARLEEGFRLVFEGPFDAVPESILGS